jgi:SagB-type dehydrogenase family enzyme
MPIVVPDLASLGALLELAFGLSAWKSWGPSRWALRCNPSSGNLHPVEAYVLSAGLPGVADGLHHYDPEEHALEGRALVPPGSRRGRWLAVGLSSVMWREAWKYGERAFRYCQLDVGHAVAALAYAAALLGWEVAPAGRCRQANPRPACLGLDQGEAISRRPRYAFTEDRRAGNPARHPRPRPRQRAARRAGAAALARTAASWHGKPSRIDPSPGYRWPLIDQAAASPAARPALPDFRNAGRAFAPFPPLPAAPDRPPVPRRSSASAAAASASTRARHPAASRPSYRMLDATLPRREPRSPAQEARPGASICCSSCCASTACPAASTCCRARRLRRPACPRRLATTVSPLAVQSPNVAPDCPPHLGLRSCLPRSACRKCSAWPARCPATRTSPRPAPSRSACSPILDHLPVPTATATAELLREAGLVGQVLYLEAEAAGVRGTGIGCFFDDPVHQAFGL